MSEGAVRQVADTAEHRPWVTNLALLLICMALGVWTLLGEPATRSTSELRPRSNHVFPFFKAEEVVAIEIIRGPERVLLKRPTSGFDTQNSALPTAGWVLESPLKDRADDAQINKLLNGIQHLRFEAKITESERAGYAFGEVLGKLAFHRDGKPPFTLTVGEPRPGAVVPVRDERDGALYHVKQELQEHVTRALWILRDKQLMANERGGITRISIETRGQAAGPGETVEKVSLVLERGRWRVGSKDGEHAAPTLVGEVLDGVAYYRALGVEKDGPSPAELRSYGLTPPRARFVLSTPGEASQSAIDFGHEIDGNPQERYVRVPSRPNVVYRGNVTKLYAAFARGAEDYLDPSLLPLEGGESTITEIRARFSDGDELHLRKLENDWTFPTSGPVQLAKNKRVEELAKALLSLRVGARLGRDVTPEMGLDDPELHLDVGQGDVRVTLEVGAPREGAPGTYSVRLREEGTGAGFVYAVNLGDVPMRLRDGPLELRHARIFQMSQFDVDRVRLLNEAGEATFSAEKKDPNKGQDTNPIAMWTVAGERLGTDHQRMVAFLKRFEDLRVERWVALDSPEARREYGLAPHPRRLSFRVRTLDEEDDVVLEERVILLGERVGERIHALAVGGPPAIGLIDATFLDRMTKGFTKETKLFGFAWYDVQGLKVIKDGEELASFARGDKNWMRDGARIVDDSTELEDECFKPFVPDPQTGVGMTRAETATPERMKERGLDPPAWRLEFTVRTASGAGEPKTHVLLIGNGEGLGERARWITTPGHDELGAWYDGPLRRVQEYLADHPGPE